MSIPRVGEWIEEVEFAELAEEEAKALVQKYNAQGREAGFGNLPHGQRRDNRSNRWQSNRRMLTLQFLLTFSLLFSFL